MWTIADELDWFVRKVDIENKGKRYIVPLLNLFSALEKDLAELSPIEGSELISKIKSDLDVLITERKKLKV